MWLATTIGFFSVVQKPWDKGNCTLTVRARVREDLETLIKMYRRKYPHTALKLEIIEDYSADYRYRTQIPKTVFAYLLADLVQTIDYDNFKNAVAVQQGKSRATLYGRVWAVLLELQTRVSKGHNHVR